MNKRHPTFYFALTFLLVIAAWLVFAIWIAPSLLRDAHAGRSWPPLVSLLEGRQQHSVEFYLDAWFDLARRITLFLVLGGAVLYMLARYRGPIGGLLHRTWSRLPQIGAGLVVQTAVGFGYLAAIADVASRYVRLRDHPGARFYWEMLYQIPIAAIGTFLLIGIVLGSIAVVARRRALLSLAPFLFASLGVYSLLRSLEIGLHAAAAVLLALGIAAETVRVMNRYPVGFRRVMRGSVAAVVLMILSASIGLTLVEWSAERRALADLPEPSPNAPNVLLIILDTVRAQNLSLYGYGRETAPNLEEFGGTGMVFDRAVAPAPWTLPSHATIMTGRYPHQHSADWETPLGDVHATLAEVLRDRGYRTAAFVANRLFASKRSGLQRGFARYDDRLESPWGTVGSWWLSGDVFQWIRGRLGMHDPWWRRSAETINERFLDWLSQGERSPFFVFLNYMEAHEPYLPPAPFNLRFSETQPLYWTDFNRKYTQAELQELVDSYDSSLFYIDVQLGRLFAELRARGVLDSTLVIITSDHGEEFGEHGPNLVYHARTLYWPGLHVPLVLSLPGHVPAGERVPEPVSLRDIPATVMNVIGISSPFPGRSLLERSNPGHGEERGSPALSRVTPGVNWPDAWPAARGTMRSFVTGSLHYIVGPEEEEELFNLDLDPWERRDLSQTESESGQRASLRASLDSLFRR